MRTIFVFMILMDLSIGALAFAYKVRGLSSDVTVTIIMGVIALITVFVLLNFLRHRTAAVKAAGVKPPAPTVM